MERVITAYSMPFFAKGDFTMGVFSEIAMEQQNSMFDSSAAFEDDEAFELEEMESLPVPPVGTDTVPVSAASVSGSFRISGRHCITISTTGSV